MSFAWTNLLERSPAPRPSPPGRGRSLSRTVTNQATGLAMNFSELSETAPRHPRSLGERVRASVITILLFVMLAGIIPCFAATDAEASFDAANKLYAQSKFADAAAAYEKIITEGSVSPALYFNLGNAYFKAGQMGRAIAAYRQAEELSPRDPDVRANVQFARNQVQGPKVGLVWWRQKLGTLSANEWMTLATVAVWITLGLFITRLIKPSLTPMLRPWTLVAIVGLVAVFACTKLALSKSASPQTAIVVINDATIRTSPFDEAAAAFTAHDGAEFRVMDQKNDWLQVTDGKRNVGWVRRTAVELSGRS